MSFNFSAVLVGEITFLAETIFRRVGNFVRQIYTLNHLLSFWGFRPRARTFVYSKQTNLENSWSVHLRTSSIQEFDNCAAVRRTYVYLYVGYVLYSFGGQHLVRGSDLNVLIRAKQAEQICPR
jgi:hypothetical protein